MAELSEAEVKQILNGSGFSSKEEVAQELAILEKKAVHYRADEGMPSDSEVRSFNELLDRVRKLAERLQITDEAIQTAGPQAESLIAQRTQRVQMIERAAQALAAGGWNNLMDSEQDAMANNPDFERSVLARAESIKSGRSR